MKRRKLSHEAKCHACEVCSCAHNRPTEPLDEKDARAIRRNASSPSRLSLSPCGRTVDAPQGTAVSVSENCPICIEEISDLALAYPCNHAYDFPCILRWTDFASTCPLCKSHIEFIVHDIAGSNHSRHYIINNAKAPVGARSIGEVRRQRRQVEQARRFRRSDQSRKSAQESSLLEQETQVALQRRQFVYSHNLTASHVGTNRNSNFAPFTVQDIRENRRNLKSRMTMFLRRELQVFDCLTDNREFTLQYFVEGVFVHLDTQSSGALRLVADLIGETNAKILLHELRTFLRSPFEDLRAFDRSMLLQYGQDLRPSWPKPYIES